MVDTMPRVALVLSLAAALALAACGGGDDTTTVESGAPTEAGDTEAIESLIGDYGLTDNGVDGCQLYSLEYLEELGGQKDCISEKWFPEELRVEQVSLDGDTATVSTVRADGRQTTIPVVREGEPSDAYDGWKIAGEPSPATPPATETEDSSSNKTDQLQLGTPEDRATAYRNCIGVEGAKDIKQDDSVPPSVDFSGGGSRVNAVFGSSEDDAEQGLATLKERDPFFAERFGTVVLYTVGDALADDLEIGLTCLTSIGER